jgi:sugar (pentulose or hexulose) kinase
VSATYLLGLDIGTSSCKAQLLDTAGAEVATGRAPTPWREVPTGAELDAEQLLASALLATERALRDAPPGRVAAVGIASMAEVGVHLDKRGTPFHPLIAWHDSRGTEEVERLKADLGVEAFTGRTGLTLSAVPTIFKWRWLAAHEPDAIARTVRRLNVAEWLVRALGGEEIGELSLASRTGFYDLHARDWWPEALAWAGVPRAVLPTPVPAATAAGRAKAGLLEPVAGAVLTVGGHDHLSAAVGAGAIGDGDVLDSCGSAEALVRPVKPLDEAQVRAAVADGVAVGWHVRADRQNLMSSTLSGMRLSELADELGAEREQLEREAVDGRTERGRHWAQALDEVAHGTADRIHRIERIAGPTTRLVITGGWAEGDANLAAKRRALGPFEHYRAAFAGARGAALTAARAIDLPIAREEKRDAAPARS